MTTFAVPLVRRRIATHFTGGAAGVPALITTLSHQGHPIHALTVDIRDGVPESTMTCAVLLPGPETAPLLDRLRELPEVVSAELA